MATARDIAIAVRDATIPARVYAPERSLGTILWFHGGGWVIGDLDTHDALCRTLANAAQCTVVSVAYRRAQEHRFPVALDDCWDALRWAAAAHPCTPLVVGGDSAGGNLAAVCALRARDRGEPALALQVLVYPVTDHDMTTDSYIERGSDDALMGKRSMQCDRANPEASPLRAPAASQDGTPVALDVTAWTRGRADSHR